MRYFYFSPVATWRPCRGFIAVTSERLDRFTCNLDSLDIFIPFTLFIALFSLLYLRSTKMKEKSCGLELL